MGGGGSKSKLRTETDDTLSALDGVVLYYHPDYKMENNEDGIRFYQGNHPQIEGGTFSSARIAPGCRVHMYERDHFQGKVVTKPDNNVSVLQTNLPDFREFGMDNNVTSLKVECDAVQYCKLNPLVDKIDCSVHCPVGTACNVKIANYCSQNLDNPKCKQFCMDPENNCNDDDVENYCKRRQEEIGMIPYECQCILWPPMNDLERRIDQGNGGVYNGKTQVKKGNYACWSPKCKSGTAPERGQLHFSRWWQYIDACTPITICNVDLGDTILNMYDQSIFKIENDCSGDAVSAQLVNSGNSGQPETEAPEGNKEVFFGGLDDKQRKILIIVGFVLLLLIVMIKIKKKKA